MAKLILTIISKSQQDLYFSLIHIIFSFSPCHPFSLHKKKKNIRLFFFYSFHTQRKTCFLKKPLIFTQTRICHFLYLWGRDNPTLIWFPSSQAYTNSRWASSKFKWNNCQTLTDTNIETSSIIKLCSGLAKL